MFFRPVLVALQFLTVIPVRPGADVTEADMIRSIGAFTLVGLLQGVLLVLADVSLGLVFNTDIVIALMLLVLVLTNGGFHLDGLADTFDALACRGDRERRLRAMKDSSTGAIGVTAIVFSLGLKYLALKAVVNLSYFTWYHTLCLMPVVSKWTMTICMFRGSPASGDGLGRIFISGARGRDVVLSTAFVLVLMTLPIVAAPSQAGPVHHLFNLGSLVLLFLLCVFLIRLFQRRFGGLTGDNLGAVGELSEVAFLLLVPIWQRLYIL
jgi:adenosylcobinamide-GDP ribazoletransferase